MLTGPAGRLSGSATIRSRGLELSPRLVKGICAPCAVTIHTFANAGSTPSLNHSFNSLGAVASTARAEGSDLTRRECAEAPEIPRPKPSNTTKQKSRAGSLRSIARLIHQLHVCFGLSVGVR